MQREVLIEAAQHPRQMLLLLPSFPVSMLKDPFSCAEQELPTALGAGDADQGKAPRSVHPADVFKAQKLERFRSSQSVSQPCDGCEAPEEHAPSFLLGQFQPEVSKAFSHLVLETISVISELEGHCEIISETHQA